MKLADLSEAKKYDVSAMLDSNGKEVKMERIPSGPRNTTGAPEVGSVWIRKYNRARHVVTKVSASNVWLDQIDADSKPVDGHSGDRGTIASHKKFAADFRKE